MQNNVDVVECARAIRDYCKMRYQIYGNTCCRDCCFNSEERYEENCELVAHHLPMFWDMDAVIKQEGCKWGWSDEEITHILNNPPYTWDSLKKGER